MFARGQISLIANHSYPIRGPMILHDVSPILSTSPVTSPLYPVIWRLPEIGVPLNHPFIDGFSIKNHPYHPIISPKSQRSVVSEGLVVRVHGSI